MAKIFSWKINGTNKYAYLCHVPNPEDNEGSHIVNGRIDDAAILNRIVRFFENKGKTEIVALYNEMYEEVSGRFGDNNLPLPRDYDEHFEDKFWSNSTSNNVILLSGKDGVNGLDGIDGNGSGGSGSGQQGLPGPRGPVGEKGDTGPQGPSGSDGRDGVDGVNGENAPYTVDYYFSTGEDVKPNSDGYPTYNGNVATVSRPNNDSLPIWVIDSAHSGICSTTPQLVDPNNYPYRYITQAYHTGSTENGGFDKTYYNGNEFTTPVLDAACPSLSDSAIEEIRESIENKVNGAMTEAIATIEETNRLFDGVQGRLDNAESTISEARAAAQAAQVEAQSAVNEARTLAANARESLDTVQDEISSAIESFSGVVNDVSIDTQGIKAQFAEFNSDYQSFSGVMTEFAVSASGIFQVSLLATSGLTSAMTMAHEFNSTVDGLVSRLSGCSISGETVERKIGEFTTSLDGLSESCTRMEQDVNGLSATTVEWGLGLQGLSGVMVDVQESKDVISASTMELEASINGLNLNLTGTVSGNAISLETKTAQLQADLDKFNHELTAFEDSDSGGTIAYKKSQFEHDINSLKHELTETEDIESGTVAYKKSVLQHDINGLQIMAQHLSESATTISGKTMSLQASIDGISGEFDEASEDAYNFNSRLLQLSATTQGLTTRVAETEKSLDPNQENSIATRVSQLEQTVTGFDVTVIENLSGNVVSNINKITSQGNEITALSATTSGTAAVVNEMRSDYNQFVVSSSEWKKKSDGTFVTKSWNEDDSTSYGYDYIGEPTPIKQYVYYAKDSGVWPQCLYGRYISGTNVVDKYNKIYVFENEYIPYDYTAAVSGWFYTNKEETQIFDGNIRRGGPTGEIITNIYTSKHSFLTTDEDLQVFVSGYIGYMTGVFVPSDKAGYTKAHWESSNVANSNPGLTYGGNVVLPDLLYYLSGDDNTKDYSINYDGTLANVRGFTSAEYDASRWETYYNALTTGTTNVCGGDISVTDFIVKYCYSVISEFSGVKQTPSAINMWVKNASTAAQIAAGINQAGSEVTISADHIHLNGNVIASALTAYTGDIGGVNFKDKCITSTNWNGGDSGFKIDMANGIISANTIYLGGGSSASGSGIQLDVEYGDGENTYRFGADGLLSAKNAVLEGGLIGGILIHENSIEGKNFSFREDGKIFANGLDVASKSLILNDNELLFMRENNPVANITSKKYNSLSEFINPDLKDATITSINNSSDILIFSAENRTTVSRKTASINIGGDNYKGWLDIASAITRSLSSVKFSGTVEYKIILDTVNRTAGGGSWTNGTSSYGNTIHNSNGSYGTGGGYYNNDDDSINYSNIADINLKYVDGDDSYKRSVNLYGDGSTYRYGAFDVSCDSGYSWVAVSSSLDVNNGSGANGGRFTVTVPQGSLPGIYYVDVYYANQDIPGTKSAVIVIQLYDNLTNQIVGTNSAWLKNAAYSSGRKVAKAGKLSDEEDSLHFLTENEINPNLAAAPFKNFINNEEEIVARNNSEVLGNVADSITYEIKLNESNVYLLKGQDYDKTISVSGGSICGTTVSSTSPIELSVMVPVNGSFTLNKSDYERILSIGGDLNGAVNLSTNTGNLCQIKVICKVILKSGFTLGNAPLKGFTEIFTNGLGYYGDENNYLALVESSRHGLLSHTVSNGIAYPYAIVDLSDANDRGWFIDKLDDGVHDVISWIAVKLSYFEQKRNIIIKIRDHREPTISVYLPATDLEEKVMDLRPGDSFNILAVNETAGALLNSGVTTVNQDYNITLELDVINQERNVVIFDTGSSQAKTSAMKGSSFEIGSNAVLSFKLLYLGRIKYDSTPQSDSSTYTESQCRLWYLSRERYY